MAASTGSLFFDAEAVVLADKKQYFTDQIHLSPSGAQRLALSLADFLEPVIHSR